MKKNLINIFALLVLSFALVSSVHAYGGGGSSKKCKRPVFTEKSPPNGSVVSPKSGFSFVASANTKKSSIVVKIKGEEITINLTDQGSGRTLVKGVLPGSITEGFAGIKIFANSSRTCDTKDGWLLKVGDS